MSDWTPQNDRQHPPFEPGNRVALRHGAKSPRVLEPAARSIVDELLEQPGLSYLRDPAYTVAVEHYGKAVARVELLERWLSERFGRWLADPDSIPSQDRRRLMALEAMRDRAEGKVQYWSSRLGLDPLSRSKLGRNVAATQHDLAQAWAAEAAREAEAGGPGAA